MRIVGRGNANILIDYGDPKWLYRCCVRYSDSLRKNNEYSIENFNYIERIILPILGDYLCPMRIVTLPLKRMGPLIDKYVSRLDDVEVVAVKILNLKPAKISRTLYSDHFTKIFSSGDYSMILMEFKPKWLFNFYDHCRNCTHHAIKGRAMTYCYRMLLSDPNYLEVMINKPETKIPEQFIKDAIEYFGSEESVLRKLFKLQKQFGTEAISKIASEKDITDKLLLEMTLKDVTCFLSWQYTGEISCRMVDVDLKPKEKWTHWVKTHNELCESDKKIYHD